MLNRTVYKMFQEQMNTENASVRAKAPLVNAKQEQQSVWAAQNLHEISNSFSAVQVVMATITFSNL